MSMPRSTGRPKGSKRIEPARLEDLPTVLDADEVANVLRISRERVCELVNSGRLRRLEYSKRAVLIWADELRRFLADESDLSGPTTAADKSLTIVGARQCEAAPATASSNPTSCAPAPPLSSRKDRP